MRHLIIALSLFGLILSSVAAADVPEPPLYQRFRPVTSLPWREPGATLESCSPASTRNRTIASGHCS